MKVTIERAPGYAPCSYLVVQVGASVRDATRTVLSQSDYDWPLLAANLGYVACECGETDGTVDCPHRTAHEMIQEASEFLDRHLGEAFDDPGYF